MDQSKFLGQDEVPVIFPIINIVVVVFFIAEASLQNVLQKDMQGSLHWKHSQLGARRVRLKKRCPVLVL